MYCIMNLSDWSKNWWRLASFPFGPHRKRPQNQLETRRDAFVWKRLNTAWKTISFTRRVLWQFLRSFYIGWSWILWVGRNREESGQFFCNIIKIKARRLVVCSTRNYTRNNFENIPMCTVHDWSRLREM